MERNKSSSYDKAIDHWGDAKIRFSNAWPYLQAAVLQICYTTTWLLLVVFLKARLNNLSDINVNDVGASANYPGQDQILNNFPDATKKVVTLHQIGTSNKGKMASLGMTTLIAATQHVIQNPQSGPNGVKKFFNLWKDLILGAYSLIKASCYYAWYFVSSENPTSTSDKHPDSKPAENPDKHPDSEPAENPTSTSDEARCSGEEIQETEA